MSIPCRINDILGHLKEVAKQQLVFEFNLNIFFYFIMVILLFCWEKDHFFSA
jgi:hypothetical protein